MFGLDITWAVPRHLLLLKFTLEYVVLLYTHVPMIRPVSFDRFDTPLVFGITISFDSFKICSSLFSNYYWFLYPIISNYLPSFPLVYIYMYIYMYVCIYIMYILYVSYMYIICISYMYIVYVYCVCSSVIIYIYIYIYKSHDFRWFTINHHFVGRDGTAPKVMSTAPNTMKFWAIPRSAVGLVLFCTGSGGVPRKGDFSMKHIYIYI